ncbi:MAG: hypothetical protein ACRDZ2_03565 [Ilumatobacteraceae bacterium]
MQVLALYLAVMLLLGVVATRRRRMNRAWVAIVITALVAVTYLSRGTY